MTAVARWFAKTQVVRTGLVLALALPVTVRAQDVPQGVGMIQVGDRISLIIDSPNPKASFGDTVTIRHDLRFSLPNIGEVSMQGVRRDSAESFLTKKVAEYVKGATVRATVLVPIGVFGSVLRPGYVSTPTDKVFRDVLQLGGGALPTADPERIVVKRQSKIVMTEQETRAAVSAGKTIGELPILPNDIVEIQDKAHHNFTTFLQFAGIFLTTATLAITLARQR